MSRGYIPNLLYRNMGQKSTSIYILSQAFDGWKDDWGFDFIPVCLILSRDASRCLIVFSRLYGLSRLFSYISHAQCAVLKQDFIPPPPTPFFNTSGGEPAACSSVRLPVSSACLLTCPLSFLIVLPNLVCGLCGLLKVVYIDWNIGYHVNCQEGNDGQCSPVRRLRR